MGKREERSGFNANDELGDGFAERADLGGSSPSIFPFPTVLRCVLRYVMVESEQRRSRKKRHKGNVGVVLID